MTFNHTTELPTLAHRSYVYWHKLGPKNHSHGPTAVIHLWPNSDWPVMLCDQLATDLWPGRDRLELPVWLGKYLHEIKISRVICDRFTMVLNDIWGHRVNYDHLWPKEDPAASWVTSKWNQQIPQPFLTVKSSCGDYWFQWPEGPSYCEYLGSNLWPSVE